MTALRLFTAGLALALTAAPAAVSAQVPVRPKAKTVAVAPVGKRIVYKTVGDQQLAIFVSSPTTPGPHPALLMIHGGGWQTGSLNEFDRQATYLAGRGIVGVQVEYRLIGDPRKDSIDICVNDAKSAMRYVRSHAAELGIDPKRIGAMGSSAGAQLAGFLGMMDGKDDPHDDLKISAKANLMVLISAAIEVGPGPEGCCHGFGTPDAEHLSPARFVRPGLPPTLVLQGAADQSVSPARNQRFAEQMKAAGNDCTIIMFPDGPHGFFHNGPNFYLSLEDTDKFLSDHHWISGPPDEAALHALPAREAPGSTPAP